MKQDQAKQVETGSLVVRLNEPNELTTADLDAVTGGTGKHGSLAAACCTGKHFPSAIITS